jgi:hypothetical protein
MAASVLNSPRAIEVSIHVVQAFVRLREARLESAAIRRELDALDRRLGGHDIAIRQILETLRQLTTAPAQPRRRIGFL